MTDQNSAIRDELMTTEEVAAYFKVGKSTVYSWASQGLLRSTKVGGSRRWLRRSVLDFAKGASAGSRGQTNG